MNNDLISREDLKEAINTWDKFACLPDCKLEPFRNLEHPEMFEPYVHLRDILNAIDNAPTVEKRPQGEWISVSERLPERYKEVIVTDIETSETYVSRYIGNGYWECDNGSFNNRIIAWQPLPKPYKEADNDN